MNGVRLILRSLLFYWRTNLGVMLGAAVGASVIGGALVVGDSVTHSLRLMAAQRLGNVSLAMATDNRFFRDELADEFGDQISAMTAAVLRLRGVAAQPDATARANGVRVMGVDQSFWSLGTAPTTLQRLDGNEVIINTWLAKQLRVQVSEEIVFRVERPSTLPRDVPLASTKDASIVFRATVRAIADAKSFGRFSLQVDQIPPYNAFVSRAWLQQLTGLVGQANIMLVAGDTSIERANAKIKETWQLADAELELRVLSERNQIELRSRRVFLDPAVGEAIADIPGQRVLAYFVNQIRAGKRATPYSVVAGIEVDHTDASNVVAGLANDEIAINEWLAEDLSAKVGDTLELTYFSIAPGRNLVEKSKTFRLGRIVPIEGLAADRQLMPDFPGLAESENCRDWDPGIPIELDRIRDKDEAYWNNYRGTPKAFVTLEAGRAMWQNRFGDLTAVRFSAARQSSQVIAEHIRKKLLPKSVGLVFEDVRTAALQASDDSLNFGWLFIGLSSFLVASAALLTALLFVFGLEERAQQVGILLTMGLPPRYVRWVLLGEGMLLAVIGSVAGSGIGLLYTRMVLAALATVWRGAVASASITFHVELRTVVTGMLGAVVVAVVAMAWTLGRVGKRTAKQLLANEIEAISSPRQRPRWALVLASAAVAMVAILLISPRTAQTATGVFFGGGIILLAGSLSLCYAMLTLPAATASTIHSSLYSLGLRNSMRRRGRSLATVALVACGVYLVIAVGMYRIGPLDSSQQRASGTGGFALYGQSALALLEDLNEPAGQAVFGLRPQDLAGTAIVPMRLREGDDASCLNLNRAQKPRLVGVRPALLQSRGAFSFVKTLDVQPGLQGWQLLETPVGPGEAIPAIADQATVVWALGKKLGDTIEYMDERGEKFEVKIVGLLGNSILQGNLVIAEEVFEQRFAQISGYRIFLIDVPAEWADDLKTTLSRALDGLGMELSLTADRLAAFNTVQNTYLSIFQALGGLGLVLGSVGLGMVMLRNVLERRSELAVMRAVGFSRWHLWQLLSTEHGYLLAMGLGCGMVSAMAAVAPQLGSGGQAGTMTYTWITVAAVLASGLTWICLAAMVALRGPLLNALNQE